MQTKERVEARITGANNVLVAPPEMRGEVRDFCGSVVAPEELSSGALDLSQKTVYLCGDVSGFRGPGLGTAARVFVVRELAHGYDAGAALVDRGRVPALVHGAGVYYRRFFDPGAGHFDRICAEHTFQALTESTKPGTAHRTGIYLTPVRQDRDELHFRLLRCSTNLAGPTDNFRATDHQIVDALNREAATLFENPAPLNHVLAQVYRNTPAGAAQKPTKARISAHADKTKDMPANGVMAFCTFYDRLGGLAPDGFDYGYNGVSGLTRLHFRLKDPTAAGPAGARPAQFTLTLYPGSVFFMPLSTNRLYTHEIRAAALGAERLPTRLGYVVRCSRTEAVHKDGRTFLKAGGALVELEPPTPDGMAALRQLYAEENTSAAAIDYGDRFPFSMNTGDYLAPRT